MNFSGMKLRAINGVKSYFNRTWNFDDMMNIDEIPHEVHTRLKKVYLTLFCAMLSSAFGSYLQWISIAGGKFTVLSCVASLIWIYFTPPGRLKTRVLLLMLAAYSFGASISAYINYLYKIEQCYVLKLLLGDTMVSGNFLYRATRTRERMKIYYSCLPYCFVLMISGIASILLDSKSTSFWVINIHTQQMLFMAFLVIYSQEILFNANLGDIDFINCTFTAFFHLPGIVIHAAARLYLQDAEIEQHN
ncbi:hypothetical protein AABB24_012783 [Solanum stoloniferum]|uniref:Uncharacterized protein n=1 Tax=Solanum stoloniferum TaxID=62892 RepID=A0ABD2U577_9SOLN